MSRLCVQLKSEIMDMQHLAAAAADQSIGSLDFLPFVEAALEDGDPWWSAYAVEAFCLKVIEGNRRAYEDLRAVIENQLSDASKRAYLLNVSRLGRCLRIRVRPNVTQNAKCGHVVD